MLVWDEGCVMNVIVERCKLEGSKKEAQGVDLTPI